MHDQLPHGTNRPVRRSPTGRVPQWALDEAMGKPVEAPPWRAAPVSLMPQTSPKAGRSRNRLLVGLAMTAAIGAVYIQVRSSARPLVTQAPASAPATASEYAPPPGHEERGGPLGQPPASAPLAEGQGFRFLRHQEAGSAPVAWSPCRPIHYVTRPNNEPMGGAALLEAGFAEVSRATGLQFINDGATSEGPIEDRAFYQPDLYGKRWAPVLVVWATHDEVPDFGVDIVGEAGPVALQTPSGDRVYVSGTVALAAQKFAAMSDLPSNADARSIVLHELGHLVGLAHVDDPSQVLFPRASNQRTQYGSGDLAGLAALGRGACQPDI